MKAAKTDDMSNALAEFMARTENDAPHIEAPKPAQEPLKSVQVTQAPTPAPAKAPAPRKPAGRASAPAPKPEGKPAYPWQDANPMIPKVFNLRMTEDYYKKLHWIGETQYGETMHSFAIKVVKAAIDNKLRELGIDLD
jgi:hypothetical protein